MSISGFPIDACRILSDDSSIRLEPFDLSQMKNFDEDYLLGFYSNASDITFEEMHLAAMKRAKEIFDETVCRDCAGKEPKVVAELHETAILKDYKYAMLPAWFVTFQCQGKPNTILVNGQTGKVVWGLPWDEKKFKRTAIVGGLILGWGVTILLMLNYIARGLPVDGKDSALTGIYGIFKRRALKEQIARTQSSSIFNFVKKRQE
jgi:hypothetical protein